MKRMILGGLTLVVVSLIGTAPASAAGGTKYFVGKGEEYGQRISFVVRDATVERMAFGDARTECTSDGPPLGVFKKFASIPVDGKKFKKKEQRATVKYAVAGRVRGGTASGRMFVRTQINDHTDSCSSGRVGWTAERVSKAEFKDARKGINQ
jgi:hypothetical protein